MEEGKEKADAYMTNDNGAICAVVSGRMHSLAKCAGYSSPAIHLVIRSEVILFPLEWEDSQPVLTVTHAQRIGLNGRLMKESYKIDIARRRKTDEGRIKFRYRDMNASVCGCGGGV